MLLYRENIARDLYLKTGQYIFPFPKENRRGNSSLIKQFVDYDTSRESKVNRCEGNSVNRKFEFLRELWFSSIALFKSS